MFLIFIFGFILGLCVGLVWANTKAVTYEDIVRELKEGK